MKKKILPICKRGEFYLFSISGRKPEQSKSMPISAAAPPSQNSCCSMTCHPEPGLNGWGRSRNLYARRNRPFTSSTCESSTSKSSADPNQLARFSITATGPLHSNEPGGRRARNFTSGAKKVSICLKSRAVSVFKNASPVVRKFFIF